MPESPSQPPSSDDADASMRPRPVASRHFRQAGEPAATPSQPNEGTGDDPSVSEDEELEKLTQKFKDLVGRKRSAPAETTGEEEVRVRRKPMPRSGNVNMSVLIGDAKESAETSSRFQEPEPPQFTLPAGLASLAWKLGVVALVMFGAGYFVATLVHPTVLPSSKDGATPEPPPPAWRAATIEILAQALAADQAGDLKTATTLAANLSANDPNLPGLVRYLADLQIRQGNFIAADTALLAQISAGREVAKSFYLRAFNAARQRHFDDAFNFLQSSLAIDPLQADVFFQMCEVLRRQGKLPDAVNCGKQALLRVRSGYGISRATIALKMRLAQIEAGQLAEVEAELAEARKASPVAAEWLFTAAALAVQRGDLAAAAEELTKARELMPRDEFNAWIGDYFFRMSTGKPELAPFRPAEDERRRRERVSWEFSLDP
jgi:tetratricopeptide (TPR) repeat protein